MTNEALNEKLTSVIGRLVENPDDQDLWTEFQSLYQPILGSAFRRLANQTDREDVAQRIHLRLFRQIKDQSISAAENPSGWIRQICSWVMLDFYRRRQKHRRKGLLGSGEEKDSGDFVASDDLGPDQVADMAERLAKVVDSLSETERKLYDALKSRTFGAEELPDLADQLQISPGALAVRVTRLKAKIRNIILEN